MTGPASGIEGRGPAHWTETMHPLVGARDGSRHGTATGPVKASRVTVWTRTKSGWKRTGDRIQPNARASLQWLDEQGYWRGGWHTYDHASVAIRLVEDELLRAQPRLRHDAYRVIEVAPPPPDSPEGQKRAKGLERLRALRPAKEPKPCKCGCGGMTRGGTFLPGHDAKWHAAQKRAQKGGA